MSTRKSPIPFELSLALLSWFGIFWIYGAGYAESPLSLGEFTLRFFSYFTILTNIAVAAFLSFKAFNKIKLSQSALASLATALTLYILVVGVVYNIALRSHAHKHSFYWRIGSEILHLAIPLGFLYWWIRFINTRYLKYSYSIYWLIYPLVYSTYTALHGYFTGYFPYPFINVNVIGWNQALINSGINLLFFFVLGNALIYWGHRKNLKN